MAGEKTGNNHTVERVRTPTLTDAAYASIRDAIMQRRIASGARLGEQALAAELGVSSRTVREALGRLVAEGLAEYQPRRGVRVTLLPLEDLQDIYDMRALLEGLAISHAAECISDPDLARMRELLPLTVSGADADSVAAARQANHEFHWLAIRASGRRYLCNSLAQLWELTVPHVLETTATEEEREQSRRHDVDDHAEILDALARRDAARAQAAATTHVRRTWQANRGRLEKQFHEETAREPRRQRVASSR